MNKQDQNDNSDLFMPRVRMTAAMCHAANKAWCELNADYSQVPWDTAPENIQNSAIDGVLHVLDADGPVSQADGHNRWLAFKRADGWVYGPVKDAELREHPCMVPYEELPDDEKMKDALFLGIVRAMWYTDEGV